MSGSGGVVAVVLAGGAARRMGGGDKAVRLLAGRPLLSHVLARIAPQVLAVALNANGDPARFAAFGLKVLPDDAMQAGQGPLAGVLAGLRWAASEHPGALLLSVPTDTPLLPEDLVTRLSAALAASGAAVACASSGGRLHPVVALWPPQAAPVLAAALAAGRGGVQAAAASLGLAVAEFAAAPVDPFMNINDPAALAAAEASLR